MKIIHVLEWKVQYVPPIGGFWKKKVAEDVGLLLVCLLTRDEYVTGSTTRTDKRAVGECVQTVTFSVCVRTLWLSRPRSERELLMHCR